MGKLLCPFWIKRQSSRVRNPHNSPVQIREQRCLTPGTLQTSGAHKPCGRDDTSESRTAPRWQDLANSRSVRPLFDTAACVRVGGVVGFGFGCYEYCTNDQHSETIDCVSKAQSPNRCQFGPCLGSLEAGLLTHRRQIRATPVRNHSRHTYALA